MRRTRLSPISKKRLAELEAAGRVAYTTLPARRTPLPRVAERRGGVSMTVIDELDVVCRSLVMLRAGAVATLLEKRNGSGFWLSWSGPCARCRVTRRLQWSHFIGRRCHRTRWELDNCEGLCGGCHMAFDQKLATPTYDEWKRVKIGDDRVEALRLRLNGRWKLDYVATLLFLKSRWHVESGRRWVDEQAVVTG